MNSFLKEIKERVLVFDGSKGYLLQKLGMKGGECPELWNIEHAEEVKKVYNSYKEAGSDVIQTNTFQGNRIKLEEYSLGEKTYELNYEGVRHAKDVMGKGGYVAASIGPIGLLMEPMGELTFENAYETYKEQVKALVDGGADIINFETFTDVAELRVALIAAKEITDRPVICSVAFEANGRTLMGTDPYTAAVILKSLGADMIGTNCSLGPDHLIDIVKKMYEVGGIYLSVKPNAGLPELINGVVVYKESPEKFAALTEEFVKYGVRLIGGCCGTTPEFISAIKCAVSKIQAPVALNKCEQVIASNTKTLSLEKLEKINAGKISTEDDTELLEELKKGNLDFIVDKAIELSAEGYDAIYVNVDKAEEDEDLFSNVVNTAQAYLKEPFIFETSNKKALDGALKIYRGKAGVIIDDCSSSLTELLEVAKKYGSTIITKNLL